MTGAKQPSRLDVWDAHAEERKCGKYSHLVPDYLFQPMVIESFVVIGPSSLSLLRALGSSLAQKSGDVNSTLQRLSVVVQWGDAVTILGCSSSH